MRRYYFIVLSALALILFADSCTKVTRVPLNPNPAQISVPRSGGDYIVTTGVSDVDFDTVCELSNDGKWHSLETQISLDETEMTSECIHVRKQKVNDRCQLEIEVFSNNSGSARTFSVSFGAYDSLVQVIIKQE